MCFLLLQKVPKKCVQGALLETGFALPSETLRFWGFELKLQGALDVLLTKLYITSGQIGFRGFDGGIEAVRRVLSLAPPPL